MVAERTAGEGVEHDLLADFGDLLTVQEARARIEDRRREVQEEIDKLLAWGRRHGQGPDELPPAVRKRLEAAEARLERANAEKDRYEQIRTRRSS